MAKKRRVQDEIRARLYRGQEPDDMLLAWLDQFENAPFGAKQQAIKEALLRGIGLSPADGSAATAVSIDTDTIRTAIEEAMTSTMAQIRRVVEVGVSNALRGFTGDLTPLPIERSASEQEEIAAVLAVFDQEVLIVVDDEE